MCGRRGNGIPQPRGGFHSRCSQRHRSLLDRMQTDVGFGLEFSQRSMVVLPRSLLCTKRVQTLPSRSTCSLAWVLLAVPVSSRTTSRSTNPLSNAITHVCMFSRQPSHREHRPKDARDRTVRRGSRKRSATSRTALVPSRACSERGSARSVGTRQHTEPGSFSTHSNI